jgi:DNA-binding NtrC family response regulator
MWHECGTPDDAQDVRKPRAMTELKMILHVDDDEDILEITRMALQLVDTFELHQCSSGRDALQAIDGWTPTCCCST